MYAKLNQNYSLICDFGPRGDVEWMDSAGKFIDIRFNCHPTGSKTTTIFSNAVTHCNNSAKTSTLTIINVTKDLNGTKVKCISNSKEEEFQIKIHAAAQVSVSNVTAAAGRAVILNCSVSGGYPETYSYLEWHHFFMGVLVEKRRPSTEDGSLMLPNTTWQDEGKWFCFASNGGYNQSNYGYLTITGPPFLQASNQIVEADPGTSKKFEVQIFPPYDSIDIIWKHNGHKISKGTPRKLFTSWETQIKGHEMYLNGIIASLTLNDIQEKDAGRYSVKVSTRNGNSLYDFQIKILPVEKSKMTVITIGLICGMSAIFLMCIIIGCVYFCHRRDKYHSTLIDQAMSTPRTRIFSIPKKDAFDSPTSNLELEIYEEIKDYNYDDYLKKEDEYLNPAIIRYS